MCVCIIKEVYNIQHGARQKLVINKKDGHKACMNEQFRLVYTQMKDSGFTPTVEQLFLKLLISIRTGLM